jgi:CheY-like chemotaxis protein
MENAEVTGELNLAGKTILIVDDEPGVIYGIQRQKPFRRCNVISANSGNEAIAILQAGADPDIILSDMMMPCGTGKDLYDWTQQKRPELSERIIFGSGGSTTLADFLEQMRKEDRLLDKPFGAEALRAKISAILRGSKKE